MQKQNLAGSINNILKMGWEKCPVAEICTRGLRGPELLCTSRETVRAFLGVPEVAAKGKKETATARSSVALCDQTPLEERVQGCTWKFYVEDTSKAYRENVSVRGT